MHLSSQNYTKTNNPIIRSPEDEVEEGKKLYQEKINILFHYET